MQRKNDKKEELAFLITDKIMEENYYDLKPNDEDFGKIYLDIYMNVLIRLNDLKEIKNKKTIKI